MLAGSWQQWFFMSLSLGLSYGDFVLGPTFPFHGLCFAVEWSLPSLRNIPTSEVLTLLALKIRS